MLIITKQQTTQVYVTHVEQLTLSLRVHMQQFN